MNLLELFVWWTVAFTPFMPIPQDAECLNPQCDAIRFSIMENGERLRLVWNEERVIAEVKDSVKTCNKENPQYDT